ncbi:substrate-binding periplasmic protein [Roseateles sp.]|jgi:polar amino acid transport system substrate-binding protein|uniref:substrate-binding periplasmic protein n=1 Tax=Roseateles sp. TaxID=1971397 RepID=UPI00391D7A70
MRRRTLLMLAPGLLSPDAQAQPAAALVVGSADPPYRVFSPAGATGLYYDLLNEAAARLSWPLRYEDTPSARALRMMERGEADLMVGPFRSPEREHFMIYTQAPLPPVEIAFYTRPLAPAIKTPDDLLGRRIAVHRGKRYGPDFDGDGRLQRHELSNYRAAFEMVARGRLDVVVIPELQGDLLQKELQLELAKQPLRMAAQQAHVVFSRRSAWQHRQGELERVFRVMREDGSWQRILQRYR